MKFLTRLAILFLSLSLFLSSGSKVFAGGNNYRNNGDYGDENPAVDLSVFKTTDKTTANVGDTLTYSVTVTNNGPENTTNVKVTDQLPAGLAFVSASATLGSYATTTGLWDVGSLNNGSSTVLTLIVTLSSTTAGQKITNTAIVSSSKTEPN